MKKLLIFLFVFLLTNRVISQSPLTICSFNIQNSSAQDGLNAWDFRKGAVIKMVEEVKPDILSVQEALQNQIDYLDLSCSDYTRIGVGRDDGEKAGEYTAIYLLKKRFKIVDSGHFWLSETPEKPSKGWDAVDNSIVTWVQAEELATQNTIFLFNTHFDREGAEARKESILLLKNKIQEIVGTLDIPVFICGDFNMQTCEPICDPLKEIFTSARDAAPITDDSYTYNGYGQKDEEVIDHILYVNAAPLTFKVLKNNYGIKYISDHYPVAGSFEIE